jgi:hypothetical protein
MIDSIFPIPEELVGPIDAVVINGITHIGFIATNTQGQLLITEPKGHKYGTSATFSKVRVIDGEKPHETLHRCFREQIGHSPLSIYPIPAVWITSHARQFYFAGMLNLENDLPSTAIHGLRWCDIESAKKRLIDKSNNPESRQRDLGLLSAAANMCLFPGRRVLLMLRELHLMGFERLRAPAYIYDMGTWRCPIVPAAWTWREHGGMFDDVLLDCGESLGLRHLKHTYSEADSQQPFEWTGAEFASPRELALRFLQEQPEIALAGWGPDSEYVRWFENALGLTAPNGLFYSDSGRESESVKLPTMLTSIKEVPLPPPGYANREDFKKFGSRFQERP